MGMSECRVASVPETSSPQVCGVSLTPLCLSMGLGPPAGLHPGCRRSASIPFHAAARRRAEVPGDFHACRRSAFPEQMGTRSRGAGLAAVRTCGLRELTASAEPCLIHRPFCSVSFLSAAKPLGLPAWIVLSFPIISPSLFLSFFLSSFSPLFVSFPFAPLS